MCDLLCAFSAQEQLTHNIMQKQLTLHCYPVFLQLQKHDREDENIPSRWRSEEEMAAEASDLRIQLEKP